MLKTMLIWGFTLLNIPHFSKIDEGTPINNSTENIFQLYLPQLIQTIKI
jgi:hypothetical protein